MSARVKRDFEVEVDWHGRRGFVRVRAGLTLREARRFQREYEADGYAARVIELVRKVRRPSHDQ